MRKLRTMMALVTMAAAFQARGAYPAASNEADAAFQAMAEETISKFNQFAYTEGNLSLPCNLFLPEGYPGTRKYPLVVFIADGSVVGKETDAPLRQGLGGVIWAMAEQQAKHKCIVLVPQYPQRIVDDRTGATAAAYISMTENLIRAVTDGFQVDANRVYVTGQSMGCMALMVIAAKHPDFFAAELFVAGQGNMKEIGGLKTQKFFYVVAEGDERAAAAQRRLIEIFKAEGVPISRTSVWDARMSQEEFANAVNVILSGRPAANFVQFIKGTVLPKDVSPAPVGEDAASAAEHKYSFDAAYKIDALREWLFMQARK